MTTCDEIKWFDYRGHSNQVFQFYIGPRGIGKSYSALDEIAKNGMTTRGKSKWLYLRMSEIELESACGQGNAFKDYNLDHGTDIRIIYNKKISNIMMYEPYKSDDIEYTETCIGYAKSLETFSNLRGVSFADVDYILFDEFIPQIIARKKPIYKMAGAVFDQAYETINRNRELKDRPPVKCYFFGNSNTIDSDILRQYGLLDVLSKMIEKDIKKFTDRTRSVYLERCEAADVTERKRKTVLYNASDKKAFTKMALDNEFPALEFENVKEVPVNEYTPYIQYGEFSIWKHKSNGRWYIRKSKSSARIRYNEDDKMQLYRNHNVEYVCKFLDKEIDYDSAYTKNEINNILGRNLK